MLPNPFEKLDARPPGHILISQDEVDLILLEYVLSSIRGIGSVNAVLALQKRDERGEDVRLVIHQQKGALRLLHDGTPWPRGAMRPGHEQRTRYCGLFLSLGQKLMLNCLKIGSGKLNMQRI